MVLGGLVRLGLLSGGGAASSQLLAGSGEARPQRAVATGDGGQEPLEVDHVPQGGAAPQGGSARALRQTHQRHQPVRQRPLRVMVVQAGAGLGRLGIRQGGGARPHLVVAGLESHLGA